MIGGNRTYPQTVDDKSIFRFYFEKHIRYAKSIFGPGEITPNSNGVLFYASAIFEVNHFKGNYRNYLLKERCSEKPKLLWGFEPDNPSMEGRSQ